MNAPVETIPITTPALTLYSRLKAGHTVEVKSKRTGKRFTIQPVRTDYGFSTYSVLVDGEVVPDHKGMILSNETLHDWCCQLEEVTQERE
jgi:hypothetical protein